MASVAKTSGIQIEFDLKGHPRNRKLRFSRMTFLIFI